MKTYKEIEELASARQNNKNICECGKVIIFTKSKKLICHLCGRAVYLNDKEKFKEKLMQELRKKGVEVK